MSDVEHITERLTPEPDGVTTTFYTTQPFLPNSVSVWVNGMRRIKAWDDGFFEVPPNQVELKEAPLEGDSVQAEYRVT